MARERTDVAHAPAACTTRPVSSIGKSFATAHQALPAKNTENPIITATRRPKRSDTGPTTSCPIANIARKMVIADVTCALETPTAMAIPGSEGSKMLVANVPLADNAARTAT
jgi:hypothetical protein